MPIEQPIRARHAIAVKSKPIKLGVDNPRVLKKNCFFIEYSLFLMDNKKNPMDWDYGRGEDGEKLS
jgi:hypothetical protein